MEKVVKTPSGFVIAFDITLAIACGNDPIAGLYLSQHNYWSSTDADPDGWICKTAVEWTQRTLITEDVQRRVRKKLVDMGFIEETNRGIPRKRHSRLVVENIQEACDAVWAGTPDKSWVNPQTSGGEIPDTYLGNSQDCIKDKEDLKKDLKNPPFNSPQGGRANKVDKNYSEDFLEFWEAYPRKEKKPQAWQAWRKQKCEPVRAEVLSAVDTHPALKREPEYIPLPASWLNGRCWEDEPAKPTRDVEAEQSEQAKQEADSRYERQRRYNARESAAWRHSKALEDVTEDEINEELERMAHHGGD